MGYTSSYPSIPDIYFKYLCQNLPLTQIGDKLCGLSWRGTNNRRTVNGGVEWTFRVLDGVWNIHETVRDMQSYMNSFGGKYTYFLSVSLR